MVSDFGLSKIQAGNMLGTACGTPGYVGKGGRQGSRGCAAGPAGTEDAVASVSGPQPRSSWSRSPMGRL